MIQIKRRRSSNAIELNMGPLIDLVFLLLIFFIVTTTFVKETGLEVHRPTAKTAVKKEKSTILIGVSKEGTIYLENQVIDIRAVRAHAEKLLAENPEAGVILVADKKSHTGVIVNVVDQCRLAGAKGVSIAAKIEE
ncbi:MAG: biopolymer transporter ExbD [Deltaproteobacteria bacterium]|nr:biopolymer transporter ExbD [Deltaproteobacteria bacterium]